MSKALVELQDYTFTSKYARWLPEEKRRETWKEAVNRVRQMMLDTYVFSEDQVFHGKEVDPSLVEDINFAYDMSIKKKVLGSQRALQFGGQQALDKNARIYNCVSSYCDRPRFFQECLWLLLCGCGAGFSVQKHHVGKLPPLTTRKKSTREKDRSVFVIPDTIEGWADALGALVNSYFDYDHEYNGHAVSFDYSLIRKKGAPVSGGVGKAPGPDGLRNALEKIRTLLDGCVANGQSKLRPIDCYDIVMHAADAVLSGGVRRSATICIFSPDDIEMATAKAGNWFVENPQRGRSNNSALLLRDKTTFEEFQTLMESVKEFGEPGFVWADSPEFLVNPCLTKDSVITTSDGLSTIEHMRLGVPGSQELLVDGKSYAATGFYKTGNRLVYQVEFESGRILKCTGNHKVLTSHNPEEWQEIDALDTGDSVAVHNHRNHTRHVLENKNYASGYCLGSFIGDGNISKNFAQMKWWGNDKDECRQDGLELLRLAELSSKHNKDDTQTNAVYSQLGSKKLLDLAIEKGCIVTDESGSSKQLSEQSICGDWSYLAGLVSGYFDADGCVTFNPIKGSSIRLASNNLQNLRLMQNVLHAFGIQSKIYKDRHPEGYRLMPDGQGGSKEYYCKAVHDLHVSCDSIIVFQQYISFRNKAKQALLEKITSSYKRKPNRTSFTDKIVAIRTLPAEDVYDCSVNEAHAFDANGLYVHNCCEISMFTYHVKSHKKLNSWIEKNGHNAPVTSKPESVGLESGWQGCNLTTVNCGTVKSEEDLYERVRAATIIGTLQSGFTKFDYLGEVSEKIWEREALLGVSMTGMMENSDIVLTKRIQKKAANIAKETNKLIAAKIGINQAARITCIKPEGTASCVLGTSSGIHPHHYNRYIRRVQANTDENTYKHFKKTNPQACEKSVWSANDTDDVISFPIEVPAGSKVKNQIPALDMLKVVKDTQQNWVGQGKNEELCVMPWLNHNVSNTITVEDDEWDAVTKYIYKHRESFCGVSLLPLSGDKDYAQAPFAAAYNSRQIVAEYGEAALWTSGLIEAAFNCFDGDLWKACDFAIDCWNNKEVMGFDSTFHAMLEHLCEVDILADRLQYEEFCMVGICGHDGESVAEQGGPVTESQQAALDKVVFFHRLWRYAEKYFDNDLRKLTYCMKDVYHWKTWCDLNRSFKTVDYTTMIEEEDNTTPEQEISCSGGQCEIL